MAAVLVDAVLAGRELALAELRRAVLALRVGGLPVLPGGVLARRELGLAVLRQRGLPANVPWPGWPPPNWPPRSVLARPGPNRSIVVGGPPAGYPGGGGVGPPAAASAPV